MASKMKKHRQKLQLESELNVMVCDGRGPGYDAITLRPTGPDHLWKCSLIEITRWNKA